MVGVQKKQVRTARENEHMSEQLGVHQCEQEVLGGAGGIPQPAMQSAELSRAQLHMAALSGQLHSSTAPATAHR